ncbi:hypothetical protein BDP27DRAFT_1414208 [Rhodocollybia butyracea]|uniref:F-box domain-containing protein n=1 Tax=Rhodocollybia butyracea TaxID=206335 RepID=A0A9P5UFA8_9AGAR|nr:hypothetical protein BDP27DRAFT_1414208 [Rhodocollybia butyracea]
MERYPSLANDPVHRLPPEIVSKIFVAFCSSADQCNPVHWGTRSRIILSSVCGAWRNIAHATPKLWSELSVHRNTNYVIKSNHSDMATQWLNRSGVMPLDLNISLRTDYTGDISNAFPAFAHRIRSLEVYIPMQHFEPFTHLPKSSFPFLERLEVKFSGRDPFYFSEQMQSQYPNGIEIFSGSHQLKHVDLNEISSDCILETVKFPPGVLTSLIIDATFTWGTQFPTVYFDVLHSYNPLNCPPIKKTLVMLKNHAELVVQLAKFRDRSTVSLSSLQLLKFLGRVISGEDIIPLVAVFPSIRILRIINSNRGLNTRALMRALVYNPDYPGLLYLPNLEELQLESNTVEEKEVRDLIQSHWHLNNVNRLYGLVD